MHAPIPKKIIKELIDIEEAFIILTDRKYKNIKAITEQLKEESGYLVYVCDIKNYHKELKPLRKYCGDGDEAWQELVFCYLTED